MRRKCVPWPGAVQKAADAKWKKVWDFGCLVRLGDFLNQCQESRESIYLYLFLRYLEVHGNKSLENGPERFPKGRRQVSDNDSILVS